jgi:hypothetical protein
MIPIRVMDATTTSQILLRGSNPAMAGLEPCVWNEGRGY